MDNFDYKKYLAKGILLKENEESPMARQIYTNSPLRKLIISFIESDLSPGQSIEKVFSGGSMDEIAKMYIEKYVTEEEPHYKAIADSKADIQYYLNALKLHLQGRLDEALLNESAPGYDTRKFGEALPTLESVKAAHEAKEEVKEEASLPKQELDKVLDTVKSLQRQISQGTIDSKRKDEYIYVLDMVINAFAGENDADEDAMASIMMDAPDRY